MIVLKTEEEMALMRDASKYLSWLHEMIAREIQPGITTGQLNALAEELIEDSGYTSSFKGYNGFPAVLCTSVNDCVVHGIPSGYVLKEGDIISIDCGVAREGVHSDSAFTHPVGQVCEEVSKLLHATHKALCHGLAQMRPGNRVGDISFAIQNCVENAGYSVVRELVGHGIGRNLHEAPQVPNYGRAGAGPKLKAGMALAVEPIANFGHAGVWIDQKGQYRTKDGSVSAHFEHTAIIATDKQSEVLTTHTYISEEFTSQHG